MDFLYIASMFFLVHYRSSINIVKYTLVSQVFNINYFSFLKVQEANVAQRPKRKLIETEESYKVGKHKTWSC